ncbi:MAG: potassium transporter [Aestuariibacter sp.]|nr:potassium transporter [Aestuariibacter sp.]MCP4238411.1 potassium transporter [Aestuariibacter sp.]MCP4527074.1 potassium transporter [Aestuariibacter sp.]MCP4946660.1 potassium transporter [Aestuariibacter sp.]MCP5010383.1 potassium transporter [Aestuariibacter sp.]
MLIAVVSVAVFKRIHLPPILAYLFAGVIAGPSGISLFAHPEEMHLLAEVGIVFLLFSLGLEFSLPKLLAMRSLVFGAGLLQMLTTTLLGCLVVLILTDVSVSAAIVLGGMLALSSTAIVIKQVTEMGILNNVRTQLAISILLFQDLAVVPFLIVIPLLSGADSSSLAWALSLALVKGVVVVAVLMSVGKWLLPWVFREVARTRTDELFVLTTILVALLAGGLTYAFGLSMALGAFLAGMMLGESQYKYQLEADIRPFRDILMGLFFATVGMQLELRVLFEYWYWIILGVALLMVTKVVLVRVSASLFAMSSVDAWSAGIKLCQVGEFSFVIAALANTHGVITPTQSSVIVCIGVISMALTPYLIERSLEIAQWLAPDKRALHTLEQPVFEAEDIREHVVICGFGRVGQSVARMLDMEEVEYVVVDVDPIRVHESRSAGEPVIFGDATQKDILLNAGITDAKLVLITFSDAEQAKLVIDAARQCREDIDVMVRTYRDAELDALYKAGASQVVPELQEGSLMLITQVMHYAGIPMSRILRRVREERKGRYDHLHGFYPGETTEISYGTADKLEFIHAVVLGADAFAIGKTIAELGKLTEKVKIKSIRRGTVDWDPADWHQALASGDIVVVAGKPRRVERAERYLLEGD